MTEEKNGQEIIKKEVNKEEIIQEQQKEKVQNEKNSEIEQKMDKDSDNQIQETKEEEEIKKEVDQKEVQNQNKDQEKKQDQTSDKTEPQNNNEQTEQIETEQNQDSQNNQKKDDSENQEQDQDQEVNEGEEIQEENKQIKKKQVVRKLSEKESRQLLKKSIKENLQRLGQLYVKVNKDTNKAIDDGKRIIIIETCHNCLAHNYCTHHKEDKYEKNFIQCKQEIEEKYPNFFVSRNYMIPQPQIGSFEIRINGSVIYSKLQTGKWPKKDLIVCKLNEFLENEKQELCQDNSVQNDNVLTEIKNEGNKQ